MSVTWDFSAHFLVGDLVEILVGEDVKDEILGAPNLKRVLVLGIMLIKIFGRFVQFFSIGVALDGCLCD